MNSSRERLMDSWPPSVTILFGHPCCLKSTVARDVCAMFEIFGVFTHQMGAIRALWGEPFETQRDRRYTRIERIARAAIDSGIPVFVEGTFARRAERQAVAAIAREYGNPVVLAYAYSSDVDVVLNRFAYRAARCEGPDHRANDAAIYFDSIARFERPDAAEAALYDGYAEMDSATKRWTRCSANHQTAADILNILEEAYRAISW